MGELAAFPARAPLRMVEILPAARGIDTGRLKMPGGIRADPDIAPRRRDYQIMTPSHLIKVSQDAATLIDE